MHPLSWNDWQRQLRSQGLPQTKYSTYYAAMVRTFGANFPERVRDQPPAAPPAPAPDLRVVELPIGTPSFPPSTHLPRGALGSSIFGPSSVDSCPTMPMCSSCRLSSGKTQRLHSPHQHPLHCLQWIPLRLLRCAACFGIPFPGMIGSGSSRPGALRVLHKERQSFSAWTWGSGWQEDISDLTPKEICLANLRSAKPPSIRRSRRTLTRLYRCLVCLLQLLAKQPSSKRVLVRAKKLAERLCTRASREELRGARRKLRPQLQNLRRRARGSL